LDLRCGEDFGEDLLVALDGLPGAGAQGGAEVEQPAARRQHLPRHYPGHGRAAHSRSSSAARVLDHQNRDDPARTPLLAVCSRSNRLSRSPGLPDRVNGSGARRLAGVAAEDPRRRRPAAVGPRRWKESAGGRRGRNNGRPGSCARMCAHLLNFLGR
jgi:hypothetical protein